MVMGRGSTSGHQEILKVHEIVESMGEKYAYLGFHNTGEDAIRFEWDSFKDFLRPGGLDAEVDFTVTITPDAWNPIRLITHLPSQFINTSRAEMDDEESGPPYTLRVPALRVQEDQAMRQLTPSETRDYADHPEAALGKTFKAVGVNLVGVGEDEEDGDSIFKVHYLLQSKDDKVVYLGYTYSDSDAIAHSLEEFEEMMTGATQVWEFE
ncbi:hypothetical protein NMY22_g12546 [Coprinellus aureogranulatus]|nr:hypothetical protein NMY22_g12546 [Coprinellus aureogranulatus]